MENEELVKHAERIIKLSHTNDHGALVQARELLRLYDSTESSFYKTLSQVGAFEDRSYKTSMVVQVLSSYISFVNSGLRRTTSVEREIQIDTVSDYLSQANALLENGKMHPGAAAMLIGASLEEFLRNWLESEKFDFDNINNNIDGYAKALRSKELINKQDAKELIVWAGIRNSAAHGKWDEVNDRNRVRITLESVNLFMRKYS